MVHKGQYQHLADLAAIELGGYAEHIGKISDDKFVYSLRGNSSEDYDSGNQTVITVCGDAVNIYSGDDARAVLAETNMREPSTGRAIYKKYQVLVKNRSAIIGEGLPYAQAIVDALTTKSVKPSLLYQYLEIAEHYHKKLHIANGIITLVD